MRLFKYTFIVIFFIIPFTIYSQYLNHSDIDVFINNGEKIARLLHTNLNQDYEWYKYQELSSEADKYLALIIVEGNVSETNINNFSLNYNNFMNVTVPSDLKELFETIGWEVNGHKIFWTITFITMCFIVKEAMEENDFYNNLLLFSLIFNNDDLKIITANLEKLLDFMLD